MAAETPREPSAIELGVALAQAGVGTFAYRPDRDELWCSQALLALMGRARSPSPSDAGAAIHVEDRRALWTAVTAVLEGRSARFEIELRFVRADDGRQRWVVASGSALGDGPAPQLVGTVIDVSDRREARDALAASEARYRRLVNSAPEAIVVVDPRSGRFVDANPGAERLFGLDHRRLLERGPAELSPELQPDGRPSGAALSEAFERTLERGALQLEWTHRDIDHRELVCEVQMIVIDIGGAPFLRGSIVDVTDRRRVQSVTDQRSRLESLGRLAGGVAHDFNNLLTAIRGHASLALKRPPDDPRIARDLATIEHAAERAGELTRQLLVFARQHRVRARPIDLNEHVRQTMAMIEPLVPANIRLRARLEDQLWPVVLDPGQLEQVLLNLVLNARDALAGGGRITIRSGNLPLGEEDTGYAPGVPVGDWVVLSVADTGTGIAPEVLEHIFEPFFTTKGRERGSGLGLATCHSIVQHAGGRLVAHSEPGMGSIFRAFFPRAHSAEHALPAPSATAPPSPRAPPEGQGTILVVEDEAMVREVAVSALASAGYRVLEASDAEVALDVSRRHAGEVDLLVTDVIMPGLSGPQLAELLRRERPEVPVLYVSGYVSEQASGSGVEGSGALSPPGAFLAKPYTPDQLGHKVGELLRAR